jgi:flagellar motor switch protein FliN
MMTRRDLSSRFATELTRVVAALLETSASRRPGVGRAEDGFVVTIAASDGQYGELLVYFARAGAEAVTKAMTASAVEPSEAVVLESLKEICGQAANAFDRGATGATLVVAAAHTVADIPKPSTAIAMEIVMKGHEQPLHVTIAGDLEVVAHEASGEAPERSRTLDVIMDIDLPLVVRFGRTELSLKALTALGPGSVIDLGRGPDEPVDVLISNRVVARGEVVIVGGNYGVRVRDVISAAERARSLEAELV